MSTTRSTPSPPRIAASEGSLPSGPSGLSFFAGVSDTSTGVCASAPPADIRRSATVPVRTVTVRAGFIAADSSKHVNPGLTRIGEEPEMGFEPMTYHLRGGCSARLSYSGAGVSLSMGAGTTAGRWRPPFRSRRATFMMSGRWPRRATPW